MKNLLGFLFFFTSGTAIADDQILAQYSVTGMNVNQQATAISQGIQQFKPDQITLTYPGAMTFLANQIASNIATSTKTPITLNLVNSYWPSVNFPTGQVVVNLIGNSPAPQPSPTPDSGSFFGYTNSTQGSFFN